MRHEVNTDPAHYTRCALCQSRTATLAVARFKASLKSEARTLEGQARQQAEDSAASIVADRAAEIARLRQRLAELESEEATERRHEDEGDRDAHQRAGEAVRIFNKSLRG